MRHILPTIVIAQFFCTSLWFAGNAVMADMGVEFQLLDNALGHLTSAVQFGFIVGTLFYALLTIADRFSPSRVFLVSALLGALCNLGITIEGLHLPQLFLFRFLTGFFLAGIYPVGMKIAADYYQHGLGKALSFLVGALVLGTAFPHLLKGLTDALPWRTVLMFTSGLATLGGLLLWFFVPNGPYRKHSQQLDITAVFKVFKNSYFRSAAFGYFGHMWELYVFWAFAPIMLSTYQKLYPAVHFSISIWAFFIIGIGGIACMIGGYLAQRFGEKRVASIALLLSCSCCLLSPLLFMVPVPFVFITFLLFWGMVVIADSPLFSTLVARNAIAEFKGTALTIVNCIGFAITIVSIQLATALLEVLNPQYIYSFLAAGPILGLIALRKSK